MAAPWGTLAQDKGPDMPFLKSPILTPAKLAANRANGGKSAGPRTAERSVRKVCCPARIRWRLGGLIGNNGWAPEAEGCRTS